MTGQEVFNALHTQRSGRVGCRFKSERGEMDEEMRWYGFAGQVHRSRHPREVRIHVEQGELSTIT